MNKTVTINISGIIFHIEEDAFDKLSKYLSTIKGIFSKTDGGNEIMGDIEARIAEMLQSKTSAIKQVVLVSDVDSVIETMGKPEEFAGEDPIQSEEESKTNDNKFESGDATKKRMFRDPDAKAIGGVCGGIAAYFDVDVVWIRLAMFLLIFFGGVSLWLYIILWIVIPEAKTTADKLAMRGEKIDINNISKTVKEEAEQLKNRAKKYGNDIKNNSQGFKNDSRNFAEKFVDFIKDIFILFGKFFARLIGLILVIFGVCFMFSLISGIFGFSVMGTNTEVNDWINLIFLERSDYTLGLIGIVLFLGIPILMSIYGGVKLLFKIKYSNRWMNLSAGLIWLVGLAIVIFIGISTGKEFSDEGKVKQEIKLAQRDTFYLSTNDKTAFFKQLHIDEDEYENFDRGRHDVKINNGNHNYGIAKDGNKNYIIGYATLNIVASSTDNFELFIIKKARGEDKRAATERAKVIEYKLNQTDSLLSFDEVFSVAANEKFRVQQVTVLLKVPRGKVVFLDKKLKGFIYDVENVTNTFDGDMVDRRWKMTKDGLQCIDCDGLEMSDEEKGAVFVHPTIPISHNLNVNGENTNVNIDKDGIKVNSDEANVHIKKNGEIHVDTKGKKGDKGEK